MRLGTVLSVFQMVPERCSLGHSTFESAYTVPACALYSLQQVRPVKSRQMSIKVAQK